MVERRVFLRSRGDAAPQLRAAFAAIRAELTIPEVFPEDVLAEVERAVAGVERPERDETGLPFFTIDPPGSTDLDQAIHLSRGDSGGWRVRYAIADVPAYVLPGGAVDEEARRRGQTIYLPDGRAPLHPPRLSEDAASLLPGQLRSAYVWDITLDAVGEVSVAEVYRARVRSLEQLDYAGAQRRVDAAGAITDPAATVGPAGPLDSSTSLDSSASVDPPVPIDPGTAVHPEVRAGVDAQLLLLRELGLARLELERRRGGASLPKPEQEVIEEDGHFRLRFRPVLAVEDWNAQLSLLTGMVAARMMLDAKTGILRTMPAPDSEHVERFRRQASALGVPWPLEQRYGDFLRGLDHTDPRHLALIHHATSLFRGAGYTPFNGTVPEQPEHAAVAAPYAHVTAPLRRLIDRFGLIVCEHLSRGEAAPDWVRAALAALPGTMQQSDRLASAATRAATDAVEAAVLAPRVGAEMPATVVASRGKDGVIIQLDDPAVLASCPCGSSPGEQIQVRLIEADVAARLVRFEPAG